MRFLSGFLTGFVTMLLVIIIVFCCLFLAVPVSTYAGWFGLEMDSNATLTNASIVEFGTELINTVGQISEKSLADIKATFGIDVYNLLKTKLGIAPDDTTFDNIATCKVSQIPNEVKAIHIEDLLAVAKVNLDANTKEIMEPLLSKSITEITVATGTAISDVVNGIKVANIKAIDANILPNIPLFSEANNNKGFVDIVKDFNSIKLNEVIANIDPNSLIGKLKVLVDKVDAEGKPVVDAGGNPVKEEVKLVERPIGTISKDIPTAVKSVKLNELVDIYNEDDIENGVVTHQKSPKILIQLQNETLDTLSSKINSLTLNDVLEIDTTKDNILTKLTVKVDGVNTPILDRPILSIGNEITEAIKGATLGTFIDIYTEDVIEGGVVVHKKSPAILIKLKNSTLNTLSSDIDTKLKELKITDIITPQEGTLLNALPKDTTINNIEAETQKLIKTSTIAKLQSWGMFPTTVDINTDVSKIVGEDTENVFNYIEEPTRKVKTIGECTVEQLININVKALKLVKSLEDQLAVIPKP